MAPPARGDRRAAAVQPGAAHRPLFQRAQELTMLEHIAARVTDEAGRVFDLLEPGLGDYAIA
ncbi:hypothetical protein ACWDO0_24000 [Nocardia rhamnosiphila]